MNYEMNYNSHYKMNIHLETPKDMDWIKSKRNALLETKKLLPRYGKGQYPNLCGTDNLKSLANFIENYDDARFCPQYTDRLVSLNNIIIEERLKKMKRQIEDSNQVKMETLMNIVDRLSKENRELKTAIQQIHNKLTNSKIEIPNSEKEYNDVEPDFTDEEDYQTNEGY